MMKFVLFKFSVEWLFTIYEIRKGSKKFYNCVNLLNLYYFTRNGSSFCLIPLSLEGNLPLLTAGRIKLQKAFYFNTKTEAQMIRY